MVQINFVTIEDITRIRKEVSDPITLAEILSDIFRLNTLSMIMRAGSGHIGTSFSCIDIITWLWTQEMKDPNEWDKGEADTYFSSKGHDAPALYSLLIGLEKLDYDYIHKLRRLYGLPGHPDIGTPYMITNTGSLGMGISKARGMAKANRLNGKKGHFYVLTGDGELQEGQIWESLQPTSNGKYGEITVIVDHNRLQSDTAVSKVSDLGNLEDKFRAFGWQVARCDGHNFKELKRIFSDFRKIKDKPQVLIADTIKGKGVSFMEELPKNDLYDYHSGAPSATDYGRALSELSERINKNLLAAGLERISFESSDIPDRVVDNKNENLIKAYGDELVKIADERKDIVAMDADLVKDTGLVLFKKEFPERYIECGIAEQDMVSLAGGLALKGKLPIVNSFACFLSTRPNEQIYNNATEKTKIIYVGSLAGLLPATPGHSHQSVRDISTLGSVPGVTLIEPSCEQETRLALRWAVETNDASTYIRLVSVPSEINYQLPAGYRLQIGRGVALAKGADCVLVAYGPTMLIQAMAAAELLKKDGISLAVYNLPWLNTLDIEWLIQELENYKIVFTLDDHYVKFGQGNLIAASLAGQDKGVISLGLSQIPACGQAREVLQYHHLDYDSISQQIKQYIS